jgi:hypothetical protein
MTHQPSESIRPNTLSTAVVPYGIASHHTVVLSRSMARTANPLLTYFTIELAAPPSRNQATRILRSAFWPFIFTFNHRRLTPAATSEHTVDYYFESYHQRVFEPPDGDNQSAKER